MSNNKAHRIYLLSVYPIVRALCVVSIIFAPMVEMSARQWRRLKCHPTVIYFKTSN